MTLPASDPDPVPAATEAVRREWARRIVAEYRSSAITQHLVLWLMQLGFPRELLDDGLRIVADELDHAELSRAVCEQAGFHDSPQLEPESLGLQRVSGRALVVDALAATVRFFCLSETVAVPLFKELRSQCTVPVARTALDRVLVDEVRHRQFGWDALDYFVDMLPQAPGLVEEMLPSFLEQLRRGYGSSPAAERAETPLPAHSDARPLTAPTDRTIGPTERAWGLMPPEKYARILERTIDKEYAPRFAAVGIRLRNQ